MLGILVGASELLVQENRSELAGTVHQASLRLMNEIAIQKYLSQSETMVTNALEATEKGGTVKIWLEPEPDTLSFCVWNAQEIPRKVGIRMFQRNFSTKEQAGRGLGTCSMKLLGEKILGGQVSFASSGKEGTIFRFAHPI